MNWLKDNLLKTIDFGWFLIKEFQLFNGQLFELAEVG